MLQVGMIDDARAALESAEIDPDNIPGIAKKHYIMGKILYAENRYMKSYLEFKKVKEMQGISKKRKAKAWLNIGLVKTMASNNM